MPKGYWGAPVPVDDPAAHDYYRAATAVAFANHATRVIVRGGIAGLTPA